MQASPLPVKPKLNSSEEAGSSTPKAPETTMNFTVSDCTISCLESMTSGHFLSPTQHSGGGDYGVSLSDRYFPRLYL